MDIPKNFAGICSLSNANQVDFLIVGGYAAAFHGAPRFTGQLDILIRPDVQQVSRVLAAIREFGFPADEIAPGYLIEQQKILQLGRVPVQLHLMTRITGVDWDRAWASRAQGHYGTVPVCFLGRDAPIVNKRAAGRIKDLADVEALEPGNP